jgi:hypothetical protein
MLDQKLQDEELDGLELEAHEILNTASSDPYVKLDPKFALRWIVEHRRLQRIAITVEDGLLLQKIDDLLGEISQVFDSHLVALHEMSEYDKEVRQKVTDFRYTYTFKRTK